MPFAKSLFPIAAALALSACVSEPVDYSIKQGTNLNRSAASPGQLFDAFETTCLRGNDFSSFSRSLTDHNAFEELQVNTPSEFGTTTVVTHTRLRMDGRATNDTANDQIRCSVRAAVPENDRISYGVVVASKVQGLSGLGNLINPQAGQGRIIYSYAGGHLTITNNVYGDAISISRTIFP